MIRKVGSAGLEGQLNSNFTPFFFAIWFPLNSDERWKDRILICA
jgi:hypothetical protein